MAKILQLTQNFIGNTILAAAAAAGPRFNWYVDSVNGNDANAGTSAALALKTLAALVAKTITAGQSVGLKGIFRETLTVPSSGSAGSPITYKKWGSTAEINGANAVSTWANSWSSNEIYGARTGTGNLANDWNFRVLIPASSFSSDGTGVQVTLEAGSDGQSVVSGAYIGEKAASGDAWDMEAGTISQFLFSGAAGATIAQGQQRTSDALTFTLDRTKNYIVSIGVSGGSARYSTAAGSGNYFKGSASAEAGTANTSAMNAGAANHWSFYSLTKINATGGSQANTWAATCATNPYEVWFDAHRGSKKTALASLASDYDYYWAGGTLYTYTADNADPDTKYALVEAAARDICIDDNTKDYLVFDVLTTTKSNRQGFYIRGGHNTVQNCRVSYLGGGAVGSGDGHGILLTGSNNTVYGCTLAYLQSRGIAMVGNSNVAQNNNISGVWNNIPYGTAGAAGSAILINGTGNIARYNLITTSYHGIDDLGGSQDAQVYYNIINITNGTNGIDHEGGTVGHPMLIYNNTIIHDPMWGSGHGIVCQTLADAANIRNNLVYELFDGTNTNVQAVCIASAVYTEVTIDYNLYFLAAGSTADTGKLGATTYASLAQWKAAVGATGYTGKDAHAVGGNPLFVDLAGGDYHLQAGSPAIDAGVSVGLTTDYAGAAVGNPPNIGAYE